MRPNSDNTIALKSRRLADLRSRTAELERTLSDMRLSIERELAPAEVTQDRPAQHSGPATGRPHPADARTEVILTHGRPNAYRPGLSLAAKASGSAVIVGVLATLWVMLLSGGGASWPASVVTVQAETARACQNPDVPSEPGQVNFACARPTRQVLWVFALMTSGADPGFVDARTGRVGLEPINPSQGGELAWSLNLHHPYDPANPVDSLEVAARAINNIVGGATVTGPNGNSVVQAGLEGDPANCRRYTGSAALTAHKGFPSLCAKPVTSRAGQAALVTDVYQRWLVGATPQAARDTAVLFENSRNPGDPRVQAILRHLPHATG